MQKDFGEKHLNISKKKSLLRIIKSFLYVCVFLFLFILLYTLTVISHAPKIYPLNIYSYLNESSIMYDSEGKMIDKVFVPGGNRSNVSYNDIPQNLIDAVVSIEDKTFWQHHGFNIKRIFGAVREGVLGGNPISGTSTITQQLARNVYLPDEKGERSLNRKITEAWYTVLLENKLSKKQIMEAYLNTIYLGNNAYGISSAANSYFSKNVKDLDLIESAALASIPKSPDNYALVKTLDNKTIESEALELKKKNIIKTTNAYSVIYNGDSSKYRRELTLKLMKDFGYINEQKYQGALASNLQEHMKLNSGIAEGYMAHFTDFVARQVLEDIQKKGYTPNQARKMLYSGGLRIYTTMNKKAQNAIASEFSKPHNFPNIDFYQVRYDSRGNILNKSGGIMLYAYKNYFNKKRKIILRKNEFFNENGNLILKKNKRLIFAKTITEGKDDYTIKLNDIYKIKNGILYSITDSTILIPQKYKSLTTAGNLMISKKFFKDYPGLFIKKGNKYIISSRGYVLGQKLKQPQGAMAICNYKTGEIVALAGGRDSTGKMLYNRALSTRQPGSSIKPLSIYSTALAEGEEAADKNTPLKFKEYDKNDMVHLYGKYWTAASRINDAPMIFNGRTWPKNAYNGYKGVVSMRKSMEQSINVNAVRIFMQLDKNHILSQLKKFGITSLVETGNVNDNNAAALALGGMTKGISPVEMASAYGTFPNKGEHIELKGYTRVENNTGDILLENEKKSEQVLSEGVAFITGDMLKSTVTKGIAKDAQVPGKITCGKTGTTSDKFDIWFCGFTPEYSAATWIGNDVNLELDDYSRAAARLWGKVMAKATKGMNEELPEQPSSVIKKFREFYINGTQSSFFFRWYERPKKKVSVVICPTSGFAATPKCPVKKSKVLVDGVPQTKYFCPIHNPNKKSLSHKTENFRKLNHGFNQSQ